MAKFKDIDKVLDLVAKTGDKVIIVSESQDPFVLMSFRDYDRLILGSSQINHLTEEQLLNKINKDIAVWKSVQVADNYNLDEFKVDDLAKVGGIKSLNSAKPQENPDNSSAEEEERYYIEPID